jgi:AraC family transcriptional regulator
VSTDGAPRYEGRDVVGHVSFIPAERMNKGWYHGDVLECLAIEIPPTWITKCLDGRDTSGIEFLPTTNRFDPLIYNLMLALRDEVEVAGPAGRLFAETVATLISLQLVRRYSSADIAINPTNLSKVATVDFERTIEFIEEHLGADLALSTLAEVADMPVSSFVRGFRAATKMSPHKYLVQRRILRAQELLRFQDCSISEIAYRLGFSSQSHFSTVFRTLVGESPAEFRLQFRRKG